MTAEMEKGSTEKQATENDFPLGSLMAAIVQSSPDAIIVINQAGEIVFVNGQCEQLLGYKPIELLGRTVDMLVPPWHQDHTNLRTAYSEGDFIKEIGENAPVLSALHKSGAQIPIDVLLSPLPQIYGYGRLVQAVLGNATERQKTEADLKIANKEIRGQLSEITRLAGLLRKSNQKLDKRVHERSEELAISHIALAEANRQLLELDDLKSSFLGVITHELRTPLASTLFTMQIIERGYLEKMPPEERELFEQLQSSLHTSKAMIDNLVKYADFIGKQGVLQRSNVDLNAIASQILSMLYPRIERKQITLTGSISPDLPLIQGDEERLADVFHELLENAVKFTSDGGNIHVNIWADNEKLYISINDTGKGIAEEDLSLLWESFNQIADPLERGNIGLGLGLALVKHIVEAHHGEVWVKSELGVGSTFGFNLPIEQ